MYERMVGSRRDRNDTSIPSCLPVDPRRSRCPSLGTQWIPTFTMYPRNWRTRALCQNVSDIATAILFDKIGPCPSSTPASLNDPRRCTCATSRPQYITPRLSRLKRRNRPTRLALLLFLLSLLMCVQSTQFFCLAEFLCPLWKKFEWLSSKRASEIVTTSLDIDLSRTSACNAPSRVLRTIEKTSPQRALLSACDFQGDSLE
jgi:hypothetical protein